MKQQEIEILKYEEDFKDTIENEIYKKNMEKKKTRVVDINYVGEITYKDKINGKNLQDKFFIVNIEINEKDENGKERITVQKICYLGNKCIGGTIGEGQIVFGTIFENSESDKMQLVNQLLIETPRQIVENNSMNKLKNKELSEILTVYYGKRITEDKVQEKLDEMEQNELEELIQEKEKKGKDNDSLKLSKKQAQEIKLKGIQKADLNKKVDGKETLGERIDLCEYSTLYVIYSENINNISIRSNTTYSLVGMKKNGEAKVLNDEFEIDNTVGNIANRNTSKIRANEKATRDNKDMSIYTRKTNKMSIGCENDQGYVNMFLYQKTLEENENIGIQIETSQTSVISIQTRRIMNRNKGIFQGDNVQDEIQEHEEQGCELQDIRDFDGDKNTKTHTHIGIDNYIQEIINYENENGEKKIKSIFTEKEVMEKFSRELEKNRDKMTIKEIVKNVEEEMNQDAEIYDREHKL